MGKIWALADFHLSFGDPSKNMNVFGESWQNYESKIKENCQDLIKPEDLLLIAGDISWSLKIEDAIKDLDWIEHLPGTKLMIRGNHDYWWSSKSKVEKILGPTSHILQNSAFIYEDIAITGTRLWDCPELSPGETSEDKETTKKIYKRECLRLELGLKELEKTGVKKRLVMLHYPPTTRELVDTEATDLLAKAHVNTCIFGHLHALEDKTTFWGEKNGVSYYLTSSDILDFCPIQIEI